MTIRPTIWKSAFNVSNPNVAAIQNEPDIVALSNGNFLVVWTDRSFEGQTVGTNLRATMFDPMGNPTTILNPPLLADLIVNTQNGDQQLVSVAAFNGGFIVAFLVQNASGNDSIVYQRHSNDGTLFNTIVVAPPITDVVGPFSFAREYFTPKIDVSAAGTVTVAWIEKINNPLAAGTDYRFQTFSAADQPLGGNAFAGREAAENQGLDIAFMQNGDVVTARVANLPDGKDHLFVTREAGSLAQDVAIFETAVGNTITDVQITGLVEPGFLQPGRSAVVTWVSDSGSNNDIIFAIVDFAATPNLVKSATRITSDLQNDNEPAVVALPDGGFFIAWDADTADQLRGQRFDAQGNKIGAELVIDEGASASYVNLDLTTDGRILVSWGESGDIFSAILDPRPNGIIQGTVFDDVITAPTEASFISGLEGDDRLFGSAFGDTLTGGAGDDEIFGFDGDDFLVGNSDDDTIDGGQGNDTIRGNDGDDVLRGGEGNDFFFSGAGRDQHFGGAGHDHLSYAQSDAGVTVILNFGTGSGGHAALDSYSDIEEITGSAFDDFLATPLLVAAIFNGGGGNDRLFGGSLADTLNGGNGNDLLTGFAGADVLNGGLGTDTVDYSASNAGVFVSLAVDSTVVQIGGHAQGDRLSGIESLIGSGFGDVLIGNQSVNVLRGGDGDDTLIGGIGGDILDGGNNFVSGDTASYAGSSAGVNVQLQFNIAAGGDATGDTLVSIENLTGSGFDDTLIGDIGVNRIVGGEGNDIIKGLNGADELIGGAGNDFIFVDSLDAIAQGNAGIDRLFVVNGNGVNNAVGVNGFEIAKGNAGDDTFDGTGATVSLSLQGLSGADVLTGGDAGDRLFGDAGADELRGGDGDDFLFIDFADTLIDAGGGSADRLIVQQLASAPGVNVDIAAANAEIAFGGTSGDTFDGSASTANLALFGRAGQDTLLGGSGNDRLFGDGNNGGGDILNGGRGNDFLRGGVNTGGFAERDQFIFDEEWGDDRIFDFADNVFEKINFSSIAGITSLADLTITDQPADATGPYALISYTDTVGGWSASIRVYDVAAADLGNADFVFV